MIVFTRSIQCSFINQGTKDELMLIVYHEKTEEASHEADEVEVGDLGKIEDQLTDLGEQIKYNEEMKVHRKEKRKKIRNKLTMEKRATPLRSIKKKNNKEEKIRTKKDEGSNKKWVWVVEATIHTKKRINEEEHQKEKSEKEKEQWVGFR